MVKVSMIFPQRVWIWLGRQSTGKNTIIVFVGLLAFACCACVGFKRGLPVPQIHDEFSYLLAADTFASGRLTNPTHPMWKHFESMHELQKPTYMSKYPPMQGIFLAIGQKFLGHPIAGVWLSVALMCVAIYWMLQAWASPRWALIGSLIVFFHPAIGATSYWAQSYWGGAVAGMGGAMVLGGLRRIERELNVFDIVMMGLGMAILINSRPFEGIIVIMPILLLILYWTFFGKKNLKGLWVRVALLPLLIIGFLTVVMMGYYNKTVTGNIFITPDMVYEQTYSSTPVFVWQKQLPVPRFNNEQMRVFNQEENESQFFKYSKGMTFWGSVRQRLSAVILPGITADSLLSIPLFLGVFSLVFGNKWVIFTGLIIFLYTLIQSTTIWFHFHYLGPLVAFFIVLIVYGFRILYCLRIGELFIGKGLVIFYFVFIVYFGFIQMEHPSSQSIWKSSDSMMNLRVTRSYEWYKQRQEIIDYLNSIGGKHLVVVMYGPMHSVYNEWVYNRADIDKASVVWARDLGDKSNQELFKYFKGRTVWFLIVNQGDNVRANFIKQADFLRLGGMKHLHIR